MSPVNLRLPLLSADLASCATPPHSQVKKASGEPRFLGYVVSPLEGVLAR